MNLRIRHIVRVDLELSPWAVAGIFVGLFVMIAGIVWICQKY